MTVRHLLIALVGLAAVGSAAGCDDTFVDPFLRDAAPYSLYGFVIADVTARTQQVRVQRIRATVDPPTDPSDPAAEVVGSFASVEPSGEVLDWSPRRVVYPDGTVGTVFERSFQPAPDSRLDVVYTDRAGREASTEVVLPPTPTATAQPPVSTGVGAGRNVRQRIAWDAVRLGPPVVVDYEGRDRLNRLHAIRVEYGRDAFVDGGTTVEIDLLRDLRALVAEGAALTGEGNVSGLKIRMQAIALSDVLPPFDVVPTEDLGRVFVQGGTVGRIVWSPDVVVE